jgi:hypothetical protein
MLRWGVGIEAEGDGRRQEEKTRNKAYITYQPAISRISLMASWVQP